MSDDIEITYLTIDQSPAEQDYVLVESTVSGPMVKKGASGRAGFAGIQGPFVSEQDAFESAIRQATERGLPVVYAKGFAPPARSGDTD